MGPKGFDEELDSGVGQPKAIPASGWGTAFFRYGQRLLAPTSSCNGHVYPRSISSKPAPRYKEPMLLHRNNRDGTFDESPKPSRPASHPTESRRGAAFGDVFNTGNIDVVVLNVANSFGPPQWQSQLRSSVLFKLTEPKAIAPHRRPTSLFIRGGRQTIQRSPRWS